MQYELMAGGIAKISLDNGKVNAISELLAQELIQALDRAEKQADAVVLCGHPAIFSAGFDLKVVEQGVDACSDMILKGFALLEKLYSFPLPVIVACEGHAIGMGVFLLLAADYRIGANGNYTLRLPETEIGMAFPPILKLIAMAQIDARHHSQAIVQSRAYEPVTAATIGMLDELVERKNVVEKAIEKAIELSKLPARQYKVNKLNVRAVEIAKIRESRSENTARAVFQL